MALIEVEIPRTPKRRVERMRWDAASFKCRKQWSVWLVSYVEKTKPDTENAGLCVFQKCRIDILATEPIKRIYQVLGHEMLHAMSGFTPQDDYQKLGEEDYVRRAETVFWATVGQFGAKAPPLPDDFQAFVRRCKRGAR